MLYSGHFSFDETGDTPVERHGYFTCVVKADTPAQALEKFKLRIHEIKEELKEPLFADIIAVYVEDIVEISGMPDDAVVTRFQSSEGRSPNLRAALCRHQLRIKLKPSNGFPDR